MEPSAPYAPNFPQTTPYPPVQPGGYVPPQQHGGYAPPQQHGGYAPPQMVSIIYFFFR